MSEGIDGNDGLAPDFSAVRANAKIESHEELCSMRYEAILDGMKALNSRVDLLSSRLYTCLVTGVTMATTGLAAVVFHLLTRGK